MSTIKDVANLAGVSVSTVSIILNGKAADRKISADTQQKVLESVKTLNYRPNVSAKKLRSSTNKEFSVAVYWASDYRTHFLARLITGIQAEVLKYDCPINIVICPYKNGLLHAEKGLLNATFDAAIIANTSHEDMAHLNAAPPKIPFVLYNRESEQYNTVTIDNFAAGRKAARLFIEHGLTNIAMVLSKTPYLAMSARSQGFIETCQASGAPIQAENILVATDNSIQGGALAAEQLLQLPARPQAVFCDSDALAQGMLYTLYQHGIRLPEDLSLIAMGMGNPEANRYSIPALTVVEVPIETIASECIRVLMEVLEHRVEPPVHIQFDSTLIIRETCRAPL